MAQVAVRLARGDDRKFMENVIEKYMYEISPYTGEHMDIVGNYAYPHLMSYFRRDKTNRKLYIIEVDGRRAGFAMINKVSPFDGSAGDFRPADHLEPDWCLAEFTVFPQYRNRGIGRSAAELVMAENEGHWELQYDRRNRYANALWSSLCADHGGSVIEAGENTRVAMFDI